MINDNSTTGLNTKASTPKPSQPKLSVHPIDEIVHVPVLLPSLHLVHLPPHDHRDDEQHDDDQGPHDCDGNQSATITAIPATISLP